MTSYVLVSIPNFYEFFRKNFIALCIRCVSVLHQLSKPRENIIFLKIQYFQIRNV